MSKIDAAGLRESRLHVVAINVFPVDEFAYRAAMSIAPGSSKTTLVALARRSEKGFAQAVKHLRKWTPEA